MKAIFPKLGTFVVCGLALSALMANRTAQAQRGNQIAPVTIFKSDRITSTDPGFRIAAAAVLSPVQGSPTEGAGAIDSSIYKDFFTNRAISFKGINEAGNAQMSRLTPGQLAIAQTLFTQTNISAAKNLAVTSTGISGSISQRELGITEAQLKLQTISRLQSEIKTANIALGELQQ